MPKKKHGMTEGDPIDVDGIIARATGGAVALPFRPSGGQFNPFTSARSRKAARTKLRTSNNKRIATKKS